LGLFVLQACEESPMSAPDQIDEPIALSDTEKKLDHVAACAPTPENFPNPLNSTNPYFPLDVGYQWTLEGEEDELAVEALLTVLNETRMIDGIPARVIEEREWEENEDTGEIELVEISWNYYSEAADGTVCYRGEDVDDIEIDEGVPVVVDHEGRWCSADAGNNAGIFMPADAVPGVSFLQEDAPGIALDGAKIVGAGPGPTQDVFDGPYSDTVRLQEFTLIEGRKEKADVKWFGAGIGILIDGPLVLTDFDPTGEPPPPPTISEQICPSP
jgi:hypothetical protein